MLWPDFNGLGDLSVGVYRAKIAKSSHTFAAAQRSAQPPQHGWNVSMSWHGARVACRDSLSSVATLLLSPTRMIWMYFS
jgi:hypothetical protein